MKKKTPEPKEIDITKERLYIASDSLMQMPYGKYVDLNDPKTYKKCPYEKYSSGQLRDEIYKNVGFIKLYIEQFNPDWSNTQKIEIEKMLFWFGKEHREHWGNTAVSRHWLRKWLYIFQNLTENMC